MMQTLIGFIRKEMHQTLRDKRMRALLFIAPCLQMTLFGFALSTETKNVKIAVVGRPTDTLTNHIRQAALASGWFIKANVDNTKDPTAVIRSGQADVVVVPPPEGLTRAAQRGEAKIQILIDSVNVTRAQGISRYLNSIILTELKDIKNTPPTSSQLQFDIRILFNPTLRSAVYLVPGVMSVVMCLVTILLTSMSLAREKEVGTFETIIAAPIAAAEVIMGKTLPYVLLGLANVPLILSIAVTVFDVPMRGALWQLGLTSFVFICATVSIGTLISTITRTQQQAMMGGFIYLMPSLLISGLIAPVSSMPLPLQILSYANPITYFMEVLRNIMLKGGDSSLILKNTCIMSVMALLLALLSVRRFKTTL